MPESLKDEVEANISVDVFSVSAAMVGVCLTVIQLIQMNARQKTTLADDILAVDAMFFLVACLLAFIALRSRRHSRIKSILGNISDACFLIGISTMVVAITLVVNSFL